MSTTDAQSGGQPHLKKQDLSTLVSTVKIMGKDFFFVKGLATKACYRRETILWDFNNFVAYSIVFGFQKKKIKNCDIVF